jgi:hypothetical protein
MPGYMGQLGTWGPALVLLAVANAFLVISCTVRLFRHKPDPSTDIDRIMILAVLALAIGAFSHYSGLSSGLNMFGQFGPEMFAAGYAMSLVAMSFGLAVFCVSIIFWFALRIRRQSLLRVEADAR